MRVYKTEWDRLYFQLVLTLAPTLGVSPSGLCHMAADITDAAMRERWVRSRVPADTQRDQMEVHPVQDMES